LSQGGWISDTPAVRGEKQWERYTNNNAGHLDWSAKTNDAEVRTPYISGASLVQTEGDLLVAAPGKVRGEKQWQAWAQDFVNWEDGQTGKAQTRIPYASTLQLEDVKGEKQWQGWAQSTIDALDYETNKSNTRIPYASNLQVSSVEDSEFSLLHVQTEEGDELIKLGL
jgi:hypothetical protein